MIPHHTTQAAFIFALRCRLLSAVAFRTGRQAASGTKTNNRCAVVFFFPRASEKDDGLRVTTTQDGVTTVYLYDRNNPTGYAQTIEQGTDTNGDGKLQVSEIDKTFIIGQNVIAQITGAQLLAFLYDLHGSTRALVNTTGQIDNDSTKGIQAFTYDAYGNMINTGFGAATQADALTNLLYSGQYTNAATGLQYLRSRYYDPNVGRFTRMDTYAGNVNDPLSLNKYAYANGNPVIMSDPSGEFGLIGLSFSIGEESHLRAVNLANLTFVRRGAVNAIANVVIQGAIRRLRGESFFSTRSFLDFGVGFATGAAGVGVSRIFNEAFSTLANSLPVLFYLGEGAVTGLVSSVIEVDSRYLAGDTLTPEEIEDQILVGTFLGSVFDAGGQAVENAGRRLIAKVGSTHSEHLSRLLEVMEGATKAGDEMRYLKYEGQFRKLLMDFHLLPTTLNGVGLVLSGAEDNGLIAFTEHAANAIAEVILN